MCFLVVKLLWFHSDSPFQALCQRTPRSQWIIGSNGGMAANKLQLSIFAIFEGFFFFFVTAISSFSLYNFISDQ